MPSREGDNLKPAAALTEWTSFVSNWSAWGDVTDTTGDAPALPNPSFIDAIQRRRLSPLAKISLHVMQECAQNLDDFQVVYASRHGELARTTELLQQLAQSDAVSPMGFSLAVLNATAGVYSIARGNRAPCSAVSAGDDTLAMGWLEAALQARKAARPVLFVYADAPVPDVYGVHPPGALSALAMLLHADPGKGRTAWQCGWEAVSDTKGQDMAATPSFAQQWQRGKGGLCVGERSRFRWACV